MVLCAGCPRLAQALLGSPQRAARYEGMHCSCWRLKSPYALLMLMCISFCDFHYTSKPAEHRGQDLPDLSFVRLQQMTHAHPISSSSPARPGQSWVDVKGSALLIRAFVGDFC